MGYIIQKQIKVLNSLIHLNRKNLDLINKNLKELIK